MSFTSIRIDPADKEFSRYIRLRDGRCVRCWKEGTGPERINGLQNSHFHGRRKESVRFDPENCDALCSGCHQYWGSNPELYRTFKFRQLGEQKFNALTIRANSYRKKDRKFELLKARELVKLLKQGEAV